MRIAVVGAGISGLACAYELKRAGFDVDVFEKNAIGGRVITDRRKGFVVDLGANFVCPDSVWVPYYCKSLGVPLKRIPWSSKRVRYKGGYITSSPLGALRLRVHWITAVKLMFKHWGECKSLYDLNLSSPRLDHLRADVIAKSLGSDFQEYVANPPLEGLMFSSCRYQSGTLLLNMIKQAFFVTGRARYHFNGMNNLAQGFAKHLLIQHREITQVKVTSKGVRVSGKNFRKGYDTVVLACPQAKKVFRGTRKQRELLEGMQYTKSIIVAYQAPSDLLRSLSVLFVPSKENKVIAICTNEGRKMKGKKSILGIALHDATARKWRTLSDNEILKRVRRELKKVIPSIDVNQLKDHLVHHWDYALPRYTPEHVARVRKFWADGQGENGVYFCGDYMNTPFIEGSLICGRKVAAMITKKFSEHSAKHI